MNLTNCSKKIKNYVENKYSRLGLNKKNEISRLLYEVSKKEKVDFKDILSDTDNSGNYHFKKIKKFLLKKRFPTYHNKIPMQRFYLPKLSIEEDTNAEIETENFKLRPEKVYYEKGTEHSRVLHNIIKKYPGVKTEKVNRIKEIISGTEYGIKSYNRRKKTVIITKKRYDYYKSCPCTKGCLCCGYHIFNLGFGCPYECTYCYLQEYTNTPGIMLPADLEGYFKNFKNYMDSKSKIRMGSGEFTDSLVYDDITGFSNDIIKFIKNYPEIIFEFKTKSTKIDNLLDTPPPDNVVVSWSLNPQVFINKNEIFTPTLDQRLAAALKCVKKGYSVGFHFDPVVPFKGWEKEYAGVVGKMFSKVSKKNIAWLSLGTFRFARDLKKIIENRFPESDILNGELVTGFDGKLRYPENLRVKVYRKLIKMLTSEKDCPYVYLCMENKKVWEICGLEPNWKWNR